MHDFNVTWQYVRDMTASQYKEYARCNPNRDNHMRAEIRSHRSRPQSLVRGKPAMGIMAHLHVPNQLHQSQSNPLLGAALLTNYDFLVYVKQTWRMQGVGTAILDEAVRLAGTHHYNLDSSILKLP